MSPALFKFGQVPLQLFLLGANIESLGPGSIENGDAHHQQLNGISPRCAFRMSVHLMLEPLEQGAKIPEADCLGQLGKRTGVLKVRSECDACRGDGKLPGFTV